MNQDQALMMYKQIGWSEGVKIALKEKDNKALAEWFYLDALAQCLKLASHSYDVATKIFRKRGEDNELRSSSIQSGEKEGESLQDFDF